MLEVQGLHYHYPRADALDKTEASSHGLKGISFDIPFPSFIGILGGNGSGKSTLAKLLTGLLLPDRGQVLLDGLDSRVPESQSIFRKKTALILQNPENQIVGTTVEEDIAFGLENLNQPSDVIEKNISEYLRLVDLEDRRFHSPMQLSGGEQQRLILAGMLARRPQYLILDEPTSMLDPHHRKSLLDMLKKLQRKLRISLILITHYTDEAIDADRLFILNDGRLVKEGKPEELLTDSLLLQQNKIEAPFAVQFASALRRRGLPLEKTILTETDCQTAIFKASSKISLPFPPLEQPPPLPSPLPRCSTEARLELLRAEKLIFRYPEAGKSSPPLLNSLSLKIHEGNCIALVGASGSGKSTLFRHLNGLLRADSGNLFWRGQAVYSKKKQLLNLCRCTGLVFQHPEQQLFCQNVWEEVCFGPRALGHTAAESAELAQRSLEEVGLGSGYYQRHPLALSGGEQRRVAIASVLAMDVKLLLLDEPGSGLDSDAKEQIFQLLRKLTQQGKRAVIFVSHQMDEVARYAHQIWKLQAGKIDTAHSPEDFFRENKSLSSQCIEWPKVATFIRSLRDAGLPVKGSPLCLEAGADAVASLFQANNREALQ